MKLFKYLLVAAFTVAPALTFAQAAPAQEKNQIIKREFNQQQHISNSTRRGALTPRQGARLERQQMRIHRHMRAMRARNHGRLTMRQHRVIHRRQMIASRRIHRARHMHRIG